MKSTLALYFIQAWKSNDRLWWNSDFFMILTTILLTTELGENLLPYLSMMNIHNCLKSFFAEIKD